MILVLCDETDISARWATEAFCRHGQAVMMVTAADLANVVGWKHTVGPAGADFEITFSGGTRLRPRDTNGVLNRLPFVPAAWIRRYNGKDHEYAIQEMHAFYLSWLHALPGPILNPPSPQGLCGNWRHTSAWTALAVRSSLPVHPFCQSCTDDPNANWNGIPSELRVYVVGDRVVGPDDFPKRYEGACIQMAKEAGTKLLGIGFSYNANYGWRMTEVSILPDLISGGEELADAIEDELTRTIKER